jgi:hypothetical protein
MPLQVKQWISWLSAAAMVVVVLMAVAVELEDTTILQQLLPQ